MFVLSKVLYGETCINRNSLWSTFVFDDLPKNVTSGVIVLDYRLWLDTINLLLSHTLSNVDYYIKLILYVNSTVAFRRNATAMK